MEDNHCARLTLKALLKAPRAVILIRDSPLNIRGQFELLKTVYLYLDDYCLELKRPKQKRTADVSGQTGELFCPPNND